LNYLKNNYIYLFNLNWKSWKSLRDNKTKSQSSKINFDRYIKIQALHTRSSSNYNIHITNKSESEFEKSYK
jgi:hypothetical protein